MSDETATKACCKCGIDVSKAKRHKDAKSRYWCEPCFARAAEEAKAKADAKGGGASKGGGKTGSGATPAWLAGSLAVEGKRCTACSAAMPTDGVICTSCGYNTETGKSLATRVVAAPKDKADKPSKRSKK